MTHDELVKRSARWLFGTQRCATVLTEASAWATSEQPDAIGWQPNGTSHLVECKVSRGDFRADKDKPIRRREQMAPPNEVVGMGNYRWYVTPSGLITPDMLPADWGLAEVRERIVKVIVKPTRRAADHTAECALMAAELRRVAEGWRKPTDNCGLVAPEGA